MYQVSTCLPAGRDFTKRTGRISAQTYNVQRITYNVQRTTYNVQRSTP